MSISLFDGRKGKRKNYILVFLSKERSKPINRKTKTKVFLYSKVIAAETTVVLDRYLISQEIMPLFH